MIARVPLHKPFLLSAKLGLVSVPDSDLLSLPGEEALDRNAVRNLLQTLGATLGMTILARKDEAFPDVSNDSDSDASDESAAPAFADPAVRRCLEGLDTVWLRDSEVIACFVSESGSSGWESVRRLADLVALNPKLKAPLYAVTLPVLKSGLAAELHRPALLVPKKPLAESLRLLEWDRLKTEVDQLGERVRYLKPEFLEGISEPLAAPKGE
ncbi:MAG: hypothetical protein ABIW76_00115 [Fibrobacteria bacterium]